MECGKIYPFGGFEWRVLDVQGDRALLLLEHIWDKRPYHRIRKDITWECCTLQEELNDEFYNLIPQPDRTKIAKTHVINNKNPWYRRRGGNNTDDYIFLLSIEEVVRYLGDSGQLRDRPNEETHWINDGFNSARIATEADGTASWWWLRSPGCFGSRAALVYSEGCVVVVGHATTKPGGVRPALWLNL